MGNNISNNNLNFQFVFDKSDALIFLEEAEKIDYYIEECHDDKANSKARSQSTYMPNTVSLRDHKYAENFLDGIHSHLPLRLQMDLNTVKIIQLMPSADGGMPHTRPGNIICYPDISQVFSQTTLVHELWHCHQRTYKDLWLKTFKRLGWSMWNGEIPEHLENARRYNPDTIDCPYWIFEDQWIPIPIFKDVSRPNVSQVDIWFYNPVKKYHITRVPDELSIYFPNVPPSGYEHPRELTAYMLSEPNKYMNSIGFKHLIESIGEISIHMNENIGNN